MRSSEAPVASPRFVATRPSISRRPVRGANKSRRAWSRRDGGAPPPRRSPPTRRVRRRATRRMTRCADGTNDWPRRLANNPRGSSPRPTSGRRRAPAAWVRTPNDAPSTGAVRRHAVLYARDRNLERDAVPHERDYLRDALSRSMGRATVSEIQAEFEHQIRRGDIRRSRTDRRATWARLHHAGHDRAGATHDRADARGPADAAAVDSSLDAGGGRAGLRRVVGRSARGRGRDLSQP